VRPAQFLRSVSVPWVFRVTPHCLEAGSVPRGGLWWWLREKRHRKQETSQNTSSGKSLPVLGKRGWLGQQTQGNPCGKPQNELVKKCYCVKALGSGLVNLLSPISVSLPVLFNALTENWCVCVQWEHCNQIIRSVSAFSSYLLTSLTFTSPHTVLTNPLLVIHVHSA
jgi:hypothetical protein